MTLCRAACLVSLVALALPAVACSGGALDPQGDPPIADDAGPAPTPGTDAGAAVTDAGHAGDAALASDAAHDAAPVDPVPPAAVVSCMTSKPYVEEKCAPISVKGWPYAAQRCSYGSPIGTLTVDVGDPSATRVAIWILTAARAVPAVAKLEKSDPAHFLEAMKILAVDVTLQSGRIFPLKGIIGEDMTGTKYIGYPFTDGVADNCPTGEPHAFCRINSLTRGMYCAYRGAHGLESEAACRTRVGYGQGDTQAWYSECIGNHVAAWNSPDNAHFVQKLWALLNDAGITSSASGAQVVSALYSELGMKSSDLASFCK